MRLADPIFLVLLVVPLAYGLIWWARRRHPPAGSLTLPSLSFLNDARPALRERARRVLPVLRLLGLSFAILAMTRPQAAREVREIRLRSRNIMLALDISSSMKAGDFQPGNRLAVARRGGTEFFQRRHGGRVGVGLFVGGGFPPGPLR